MPDQYGLAEYHDHDPRDPNHPGNPIPGGDQDVTAAYWVHTLDPPAFMWACDGCDAAGRATSEAEVVAAMNDHVATAHPKAQYVAPPIPE